jgi:hypothetical protein
MAKSKSTRPRTVEIDTPEGRMLIVDRGHTVIPDVDHPKLVAAARKDQTRRPSARTVAANGLKQLDRDIGACRQTLLCAAEALGSAEGDRYQGESLDLASAAIRVVERCARELLRIEEAVDRLNVDLMQP